MRETTSVDFYIDRRVVTMVAKCLTKNMVIVCPVHSKFLTKNFDNGNVIGNIDFSIPEVSCNLSFSILFNF